MTTTSCTYVGLIKYGICSSNLSISFKANMIFKVLSQFLNSWFGLVGLAEGKTRFFRGYCRKIAVLLIYSQLECNSMHSLWLYLPDDGFSQWQVIVFSLFLVGFLYYCYCKTLYRHEEAVSVMIYCNPFPRTII